MEDEPLWWDDTSYVRYQAGDWDYDPPEANTAPDVVNPWPVVEYDEPPF